jgi:hypothetical protein
MIRLHRIAVASVLIYACSGDVQDEPPEQPAQASESATQAPDTADHTTADLQALRYLEGDWRGSGYEGGPFYESYRFVNDSTIEMTAWTDSTMTAPRERSEYALRDGVIRTDDGARLVRVDEDGHHFQGASYGWTFRQVSSDRWTARVGPSTVYTMDRIRKP